MDHQPPIKEKSVGLSALLTLLFGAFGMFYACGKWRATRWLFFWGFWLVTLLFMFMQAAESSEMSVQEIKSAQDLLLILYLIFGFIFWVIMMLRAFRIPEVENRRIKMHRQVLAAQQNRAEAIDARVLRALRRTGDSYEARNN